MKYTEDQLTTLLVSHYHLTDEEAADAYSVANRIGPYSISLLKVYSVKDLSADEVAQRIWSKWTTSGNASRNDGAEITSQIGSLAGQTVGDDLTYFE